MKKKKLMLEEHITAALLLIMLTILGVNIITRVLFGWSLAFTEEVVVYLFAICSIVGAAAACAHGANMGLSAITDLMPRKIQAVFIVLSAILSVFLFGVILKQGDSTEDGIQTMRDAGMRVYELTEEEKQAFRDIAAPIVEQYTAEFDPTLVEALFAANE